MKKIFTKLCLLAVFCFASANMLAQTYNGGIWYSLYDTGESSNVVVYTNFAEKSLFTPVESVTFDYKKYSLLSLNGKVELQNKVNGSWEKKGDISYSDYKNYKTSSEIALDQNATNIRYYLASGNGAYVKNHFVKLAKHILLADGGFGKTTESKSFGNVTIDGQSGAQTVNLRSFLTAGNITIKSSDNAFRINSTSNLSGHTFAVGANACASANGQSGAQAGGATLGDINQYAFNIYFCPTEAKTYNATITITDGVSTATISVSGTGLKKTQQITWAAEFAADEVSVPVGKEITDIASATSGNAVAYASSDETILVVEGNTLKALQVGEVTLTVSQDGDDKWNSVSATKTIKVTEKLIQYIHWADNLTRLKVGDAPVVLTATASILVNAETDEYVDAPERTALITYASADENVVAINGNELTIVGEGETTVTASLPGDDTFEATTLTMPVRVRAAATAACETYVLDAPQEESYYAAGGGSYEPAAWEAPAGVLTFEARSGNPTRVGPIVIQQYVNGSWVKVDEANPSTDWRSYYYELDRNAIKIRFKTDAGSFRRYFKNVLVTQATYLETTTPAITVDKSIIGDEITQTIAVQFSNLTAGVMIDHTNDQIILSDSELGTDCGVYGEKLITLTVRPAVVGTIEDMITIADEATGLALNIPVTIHTQRNTQTIIWNDSIDTLHATDLVTLTATAENPIYYTSSDSAVAYVNETNELMIQSVGVVTITAHAAESDTYDAAELSKLITIVPAVPVITALPTVEPLGYGVELTNDLLVGGEANVEGTFAWNLNPEQELIPGEYDLPIQFLPANSNLYGVLDLTVHVVINKGEQTITWNDDLSGLTTNDTVYLTATAITEVYYEVSDPAIATVDGNQLTFLAAGEVTISAFAEDNEYYNMAILEKTIYVNAGLDESIVTAYPTATSITYGQTLGESQLEGGQAEVEGEFVWADGGLFLSAGKHVMLVLFVPVEQELYADVTLFVEVEVLPAEQTITWELNVPVVMLLGQTMPLTATASSDLQVSYMLDKEGVVSIEGEVMTAMAVGTVTVTATQDGMDEDGFQNFLPAEPVSYLVQVLAEDIELGVDNITTNGNARKIIRNGQMYIIRGEQIFDALGNLIR